MKMERGYPVYFYGFTVILFKLSFFFVVTIQCVYLVLDNYSKLISFTNKNVNILKLRWV